MTEIDTGNWHDYALLSARRRRPAFALLFKPAFSDECGQSDAKHCSFNIISLCVHADYILTRCRVPVIECKHYCTKRVAASYNLQHGATNVTVIIAN